MIRATNFYKHMYQTIKIALEQLQKTNTLVMAQLQLMGYRDHFKPSQVGYVNCVDLINQLAAFEKALKKAEEEEEEKPVGKYNKSWRETFFHASEFIACELKDRKYDEPATTNVGRIQDNYGHIGLCDLAEEWTNEFETKYAGHQWEEDEMEDGRVLSWYEAMDEFFEAKNKL